MPATGKKSFVQAQANRRSPLDINDQHHKQVVARLRNTFSALPLLHRLAVIAVVWQRNKKECRWCHSAIEKQQLIPCSLSGENKTHTSDWVFLCPYCLFPPVACGKRMYKRVSEIVGLSVPRAKSHYSKSIATRAECKVCGLVSLYVSKKWLICHRCDNKVIFLRQKNKGMSIAEAVDIIYKKYGPK